MSRIVWALQILLGVFFVVMGVLHFVLPANIPGPLDWMYDLPDWVHYVSGAAEILGGVGLVLPAATGIAPLLTPLAAAGLVLVMFGAVFWHADRGETRNVITNLIVAAVLALIAVVRWRMLAPASELTSASTSAGSGSSSPGS